MCKHEETIVDDKGFLRCADCGEPVEDKVRNMFF